MTAVPLGKILIERDLVTSGDLHAALLEQMHSRSRLGDILVGHGKIGMFTLYQAVADHYSLPYVNLITIPPDETLMSAERVHDYIHLRVLPWRKDGDTVTLAASDPGDALNEWAKQHYGDQYRVVITSPFDIRLSVERIFGHSIEAESRMRLFRLAPEQSARFTFRNEQRIVFALLLAVLVTGLLLKPAFTLLTLVTALLCIYAATMLFKLLVFHVGLQHPPGENSLLDGPLPPHSGLPVYTLLVPLYMEKASLPRLMEALKSLDYPPSRLDIKLVLEADDEETVQAAMALKPAWNIDIIRVPPSIPRTKPKALNYALKFARGEYVTVFDAEDAPDPAQLRKAIQAFRALPREVCCLQARLNYYNAGDNLLTRWFAIEYGILFNALLPGLQAMQIPMPLGGTSNHLSLAQLRALGEWDPYNVTEDADLGVRLAVRGLRTAMIDSQTLEEAPAHLGMWVRQRSRWIKGYMQTWLVHMRDPIRLWRSIGTKSFLGFQFFVGLACVTYLTAPLVWTLSILALAGVNDVRELIFPPWIRPLAMAGLVLHLAVHWAQAARVTARLPGYREARWKFRLAAFLFPLYWVLHSIASYKSLWQLLVKPHFWEKTAHGMAKRAVVH